MTKSEMGENLTLVSQRLGRVLIQPARVLKEGEAQPDLIVYPERMSDAEMAVAVELAAETQTPIFCHAADVQRLKEEGFGPYRFHGLNAYKELFLHDARVEFFPSKSLPHAGARSLWDSLRGLWGSGPTVGSFHVLFRPKGEAAVLYLSQPRVDPTAWRVMMQAQPALVLGSMRIPHGAWANHATQLGQSAVLTEAATYVAEASTPRESNARQAVWNKINEAAL